MKAEPNDNALRFQGQKGHVESYFLRANHPTRPLAVWLKATILAPLHGPAIAESWFIFFDGEKKVTFAGKQTVPFSTAAFSADGAAIKIAGTDFVFDANGSARGTTPSPAGTARFDLTWKKQESPIALPLRMMPFRFLRTGAFPKSKLETPFPSLRLSGRIELPDGTVELEHWLGAQGHNWGKEHYFEYAWGQCVFPEDDVMVEGGTGRVRVAGRVSPRMSLMVVRKGPRVFAFNTIFDLWRQRAEVSSDRWLVSLRGTDGEATLEIDAANRPMVCLGYDNPNNERSYCFNSKLAKATLTVRPADGASFTCHSEHGAALEFLRREADPRFPHVV